MLDYLGYIVAGALLILIIFIFTRFRPAATGKIAENLYAVRSLLVNFYALKTDNGVILFDTGMNPSVAERGLLRLGISPDSVTHVFLTHTDYDLLWLMNMNHRQNIESVKAMRSVADGAEYILTGHTGVKVNERAGGL